MNKNNQQSGQVNVPGIQLALTGLRAQSYIIRHTAKIHKCPFDAGMDLVPTGIDKTTKHGHMMSIWVSTGIVAHVFPGFRGRIVSRSSSFDKLNGGQVVDAVIDAGYQGELLIRVAFPERCGFRLPGEATIEQSVRGAIEDCIKAQVGIAQLLVESSLMIVAIEPSQPIPQMGGRGTGGFGSTDHIKG